VLRVDVFTQSFLPNTQTSVTIPAGTLMPGTFYNLSVIYDDQIQGMSNTPTHILYDYGTVVGFTPASVAIPAPPISLPVFLGVGGILFGARSLWRKKRHTLQG
jgi:hypothetical protein